MKQKKIYIAGKITGEPWQQVVQKFADAKTYLQYIGYQAISPVDLVNDEEANWNDAMKICLRTLIECDAAYFLPCWGASKGACIEHYVALKLGLQIIYA